MSDTAGAEPVPPEAAPAPDVESETNDTRTARQKVLDHLTDSEGPQSVSEIIQGTGLSRNTCEQAIFRAVQSEQIERVSQGVYRLALPKPFPPSRNGHTNEEWIARIVAWQANPASWNREEDGPPPNDPNHRIPLDVVGRFKDRQAREAKEREKREAATARQAAADAELRDKLIAAAGGNVVRGPAIEDLAPIKAAMEIVPLERILSSIRDGLHRLMCPASESATSWREPRLLKRIAQDYCCAVIIPSMVDAWSKATGKAPAAKAHESLPPAGHTAQPAQAGGRRFGRRGSRRCSASPCRITLIGAYSRENNVHPASVSSEKRGVLRWRCARNSLSATPRSKPRRCPIPLTSSSATAGRMCTKFKLR
jgi:hypothetical protein